MTKSVQCKAEEAKACCCVDVGTIIQEDDCTVVMQQLYAEEQEAQTALALLTEKARSVETDPCQIHLGVEKTDEGFLLKGNLVFCCSVEKIIFQLSTR